MSGGTIELMCKARGFPTPKYQWFVSRGDDPVPLKGQCYMKLVIREATKENEGHYCCRAMNNLGYKFSQYAEVRVALASSEFINTILDNKLAQIKQFDINLI